MEGYAMIKDTCPNCLKTTELEFIKDMEEFSIRGEKIKVPVEYYRCLQCGEDFDDPKSDYDPLDVAYKEYRRHHSMMQPEKIRELRRRYGLTQKDMSRLLGWGEVTLSRYENGALQDDTHDTILKLISEPLNLLNLVNQKGDFLSDDRKKKLISLLESEVSETHSFPYIYSELFGRYLPDILSGFKKLNINKIFESIIFFCQDGVVKTKLNKLLFYLDFKYFKEHSLSITGLRYVHLPYGPVPDNYEHYYATLLNDEKVIRIEEEFNGIDLMDLFYSNRGPDFSLFNDSEIKTLIEVKEIFNNFNATAIKDFSHKEKGYDETRDGQIISYNYASDLQI
jgi:putative zinc finger/helix-turn-helix YgiT family protein